MKKKSAARCTIGEQARVPVQRLIGQLLESSIRNRTVWGVVRLGDSNGYVSITLSRFTEADIRAEANAERSDGGRPKKPKRRKPNEKS